MARLELSLGMISFFNRKKISSPVKNGHRAPIKQKNCTQRNGVLERKQYAELKEIKAAICRKFQKFPMGKISNEDKQALIERFRKERGYWSEDLWAKLLELDPGFFEQYLNFSAYPNKNGVIPRKYKELIYIAINAATTHLYAPAIKTHIRSALNAGASKEEILEVLEMTSVLGIHTVTTGVPILLEEIDKLGKS